MTTRLNKDYTDTEIANMVIPIAHNSSSNSMVMQESEGEQFTDQQLDEFYNKNTIWTVPVELRVPYDSQDSKSQYYGASTKSVNSVACIGSHY